MEASNEKNQVETTTTPIEEGWIEVPSKRSKKNKEGQQQQTGNQGVKAGSTKSGRGPKPVPVNSADEEQKAKWTA